MLLLCRRVGRKAAILWNRQVGEVLDVVETDERLTLSAGMLKCRTHLLSLPDCYALAVASRTKTTLLTTDSKLAKSEVVQTRHFKV